MSGILKVGGSELINDNGGSGSLQWGSGCPSGTQIGYNYHFKNTSQEIAVSGSNTGEVITFDTNSSTQITANKDNSIFEITAHVSFGQDDGIYPAFFIAHSTDGSTFTDILGPSLSPRTRATFGGQYGAEEQTEDLRLFQSSMSVVVSPSLSAGSTFYYQLRGTNRALGATPSLKINFTSDATDGNRITGVTFLKCVEIAQ